MGADDLKIPKRNAPDLYRQEEIVPVKVKNKDTGKVEVFGIKQGATLTGNTVKYDIKADGVYLNGKKVEDETIELTKYQYSAMEAAAGGDRFGDNKIIDSNDLTGLKYAEDLAHRLDTNKSDFRIAKSPHYDGKLREADALEYGLFYASFVNSKGQKGKFELDLHNDK